MVIFQMGIPMDKSVAAYRYFYELADAAFLLNTWMVRGTVTLTLVIFPNFSEPMGL